MVTRVNGVNVYIVALQLIATMQSVVTGHAPITPERKITSGGKQIHTVHVYV